MTTNRARVIDSRSMATRRTFDDVAVGPVSCWLAFLNSWASTARVEMTRKQRRQRQQQRLDLRDCLSLLSFAA